MVNVAVETMRLTQTINIVGNTFTFNGTFTPIYPLVYTWTVPGVNHNWHGLKSVRKINYLNVTTVLKGNSLYAYGYKERGNAINSLTLVVKATMLKSNQKELIFQFTYVGESNKKVTTTIYLNKI